MRSYGENVILRPQPLSDKRASGIIASSNSLQSRLIRNVYPYIGKIIEIPKAIKNKVECKVGDNVVYMRWGSMEIPDNLLAVDKESIIARAL
jgi:co-chaperonin GroES (HSP10)